MAYLGKQNPVALYDSYTKAQSDGSFAPITRSRKNLLINGDFRINQRGVSTKAQVVGEYGYDRWKGHTNGIEQIVEGDGVPAGNVTLSWVGGGTGYINGTSGTSPFTVSVPADTNISVVVPDTSTKVQLEIGGTATDFEYRHIGEEMVFCQRYFQKSYGYPSYWGDNAFGGSFCFYNATNGNDRFWTFRFPVEMRNIPSVSLISKNGAWGGKAQRDFSEGVYMDINVAYVTWGSFTIRPQELGSSGYMYAFHYYSDAEL